MADMNWGRMRFSNLAPVSSPIKPRRRSDDVSAIADILGVKRDDDRMRRQQENQESLTRGLHDRAIAAGAERARNQELQNLTSIANRRIVSDAGKFDQNAISKASQARDILAAKFGLKSGNTQVGRSSGGGLGLSIADTPPKIKVTGGTRDSLDLEAPSGQRLTVPQGNKSASMKPQPASSAPTKAGKPGFVLPIRQTGDKSFTNIPVPGSQEELLANNPAMALDLMKYQLDQEKTDSKKPPPGPKVGDTKPKPAERPQSAAAQKLDNIEKARSIIVSNPEFADYIDIKGENVNVKDSTPPDIKREINKQLTARTGDIELPVEEGGTGAADLDLRNQAREYLRKNNKPVTDANIDAVVKQMK